MGKKWWILIVISAIIILALIISLSTDKKSSSKDKEVKEWTWTFFGCQPKSENQPNCLWKACSKANQSECYPCQNPTSTGILDDPAVVCPEPYQ